MIHSDIFVRNSPQIHNMKSKMSNCLFFWIMFQWLWTITVQYKTFCCLSFWKEQFISVWFFKKLNEMIYIIDRSKLSKMMADWREVDCLFEVVTDSKTINQLTCCHSWIWLSCSWANCCRFRCSRPNCCCCWWVGWT